MPRNTGRTASLGHIAAGVSANLLSIGLVLLGHHVGGDAAWAAWSGAVAIWLLLFALTSTVRRHWSDLRGFWWYFLPTAPILWYLGQRRRLHDAEAALHTLQRGAPEVDILASLADPQRRTDGLRAAHAAIFRFTDHQFVRVLDHVRAVAGEVVRSGTDTDDYHILRKVVGCVPSLGRPYAQTWTCFLGLLEDIFDTDTTPAFGRQVRGHMVVPLQEAMQTVAEEHREALVRVVQRVMEDDDPRNDLARLVLQTCLDHTCERRLRQEVLDESKKRALRFPRDFGYDLLHVLQMMKQDVFWLDMRSLQDLLSSPANFGPSGIISGNLETYGLLCRTVFAPLEDPDTPGVRHGRVWRRLKGDHGSVNLTCGLPDGRECTCQGQSLSFRGIYSENCAQPAGTELASIGLCREAGNGRALDVSLGGKVAGIHADGDGEAADGRGLVFTSGADDMVLGLYQYVASVE